MRWISLLFMCTWTAWACGPFFPNAYFVFGSERDVLRMPEASFANELRRLLGGASTTNPFYNPEVENDPASVTLRADMAQFAEAVGTGNSAETLLAAYRALREKMTPATPYAPRDDRPKTNVDPASIAPTLQGAPKEFVLYAEGAALYHAGKDAEAVAKWTELLQLPVEERRYRSVWAAYMIGRALRDSEPDRALAAFEQARTLADEGLPDPLNLAGESLGWEAYMAAANGDTVKTIRAYAAQVARGGADAHKACTSLKWKCNTALTTQPVSSELVHDDLCRKIITAWVVSHPNSPDAARAWLNTLASADLPPDAVQADLLAWTAYTLGDFDLARKWLEQPSSKTPYGDWVRAKLLLYDGKVDDAVATLQALAGSGFTEEDHVLESSFDGYGVLRSAQLVQRELGVLLLGLQRYNEALDLFVRHGYWLDAAYIAERVLTSDELRAYVDAEAPDLAAIRQETRGYEPDAETPSVLDGLRAVLGRRYAREGRWQDAIAFLPAPDVKKLVAALENGRANDPPDTEQTSWGWFFGTKPKVKVDRDRAQHLFTAATLVRTHGMDILGTELGPDWAVFDGIFELYGPDEGRLAATPTREDTEDELLPSVSEETLRVLSASDDERRRVRQSAPEPNRRFHYRYIAADLLWKCAEVLPNNDPETMHALWTGGSYLKLRDPAAANRFYRALVWRNLNMPYAQRADRLRWFPQDPPS